MSDEGIADYYDHHSTVGDDLHDVDVTSDPDPTSVRSVRLRLSTIRRLNEAAAARGVGPTELMRSWIEERLESEATGQPGRAALFRSVAERLSKELGLTGVTISIDTAPAADDAPPPPARRRRASA